MLVYSKNPNGMLMIEGYRIYGAAMIQGPTEIPFDVYQQCRDALVSATYREGHLTKLFGRSFPEIAFRYDEIRFLPDRTLHTLMEHMGVIPQEDWSRKRKVEAIKTALRNAETA